MVQFSHLRGDDEEDIGYIWISNVDFMNILLLLGIVMANGG
jgi:hypothetical protein